MSYSDFTNSMTNSDISLASDTLHRSHLRAPGVPLDGDKRIAGGHARETRQARKRQSPDIKLRQTGSSELREHPIYLIERKYNLLQKIVQEYSRLIGLTLEEFEITGVYPEDCAEIRKAYDEAADALECSRIHLESQATTAEREGENTWGLRLETKRSHMPKETAFSLLPKVSRNLAYGSLQNIVQVHNSERKYSTGVLDFSNKSRWVHSRWRAKSVPREISLPGDAGSPSPTPVQWRSTLRGWFSVKTLTGSLLSLHAKPLAGIQKLAKAKNGQQVTLFEADSAKRTSLISWKSVEDSAVQSMLRANAMRSMDTIPSKKSSKNYEDCADENRNTLNRLHHEREPPKDARGEVSWSRRHRRATHVDVRSRIPSTPVVTSRQPNGSTTRSPLNRSFSLNQQVTSYEPTFESTEPPSGPIPKLSRCPTCSAHSPEFTDSSKPKVSYLSMFSKSTSSTSNGTPLNGSYYNSDAQAGAVIALAKIFQDLGRRCATRSEMRSYGRPNYSKRGSSISERNENEDLYQLPRSYPNKVRCSNTTVQSSVGIHDDTPTRRPPQHMTPHPCSTPSQTRQPRNYTPSAHCNDWSAMSKPINELERLTNHVGMTYDSMEFAPRPRFTLADKLNMCASSFYLSEKAYF